MQVHISGIFFHTAMPKPIQIKILLIMPLSIKMPMTATVAFLALDSLDNATTSSSVCIWSRICPSKPQQGMPLLLFLAFLWRTTSEI